MTRAEPRAPAVRGRLRPVPEPDRVPPHNLEAEEAVLGAVLASGGQLFTQVGGAVEADDQFGAEVVTGDFNDNGFADLAAGAPNEDVGGAVNAGAVSVLPGSGSGLSASGGRLFTQDSPGIPGVAEPLDSLGGFGFSAG